MRKAIKLLLKTLFRLLRFPRRVIRAGDPEQPAVVLFTSGTEGKPKGVVLSHRALLANVAQIHAVIDVTPTGKVLNVLPLFHSSGLTGGALLPLLSGAEVVLYPTPLHYKVIPELAYDRNCTVLYGTSTFLGQYAKNAHGYDFHKMRYVIAEAEKLADSVRLSPEQPHAATSIADEKRGEAIILFSTDPYLTREHLQQAARTQGLPEIAIPRAIRFLNALPVLGTGKTDYQMLQTMAAAA